MTGTGASSGPFGWSSPESKASLAIPTRRTHSGNSSEISSKNVLEAMAALVGPEGDASIHALRDRFQQSKKLSSAFQSLDSGQREFLQKKIGEKPLGELLAISEERDTIMAFHSLLQFGVRLKSDSEYEKASAVLGLLSQNPALQVPEEIRNKALKEFNAIVGKGAVGMRLEVLADRFAEDATDPKVLGPMLGASVLGALVGTRVLGGLLTSTNEAWYSRQMGARFTAGLAGYTAEFTGFALANRALSAHPDGDFGDDLWRSAIAIGALKGTAWAGNWAFRKIHGFNEFGIPERLSGLAKFNQVAIPQFSMFTGMLASHVVEERAGLRPHTDDGTLVTDTLSSMLSLGVGGHLGHRVLGPGFARFQTELALRAETYSHLADSLPKDKSLVPEQAPGESAFFRGLKKMFSGSDVEEAETRFGGPKFGKAAGLVGLGVGLATLLDPSLALAATGGDASKGGLNFGVAATLGILGMVMGPRIKRWLRIDDATMKKLNAFPEATRNKFQEREGNQVFFGLNAMRWLMRLIWRDAGEQGAQSIVEGGKILFGRWQENPEFQKETEDDLKKIAREANFRFEWKMPTSLEWWRPLWDRAIFEDRGEPNSKILASLLQRVQREFPETADQWFQELAERDVDRSVDVQELLEKEAEALSVKVEDPEFEGDLEEIVSTLKARDLLSANDWIETLYGHAMEAPDSAQALAMIARLQFAVKESQKEGVQETQFPALLAQVLARRGMGVLQSNWNLESFLKSAESELHHPNIFPAGQVWGLGWLAYIHQFLGNSAEAARVGQQAREKAAQQLPPTSRKEFLEFLDKGVRTENPQFNVELFGKMLTDVSAGNFWEAIQGTSKGFIQNQIKATAHLLMAARVAEKLDILKKSSPLEMELEVLRRAPSQLPPRPGAPAIHPIPPGGLLKIGRGPQNNLSFADESISGSHLQIAVQASGEIRIQDLGSTNGSLFRDPGGHFESLGGGQEKRLPPGGLVLIGKEIVIVNGLDPETPPGTRVALVQGEVPNLWVLQKYSVRSPSTRSSGVSSPRSTLLLPMELHSPFLQVLEQGKAREAEIDLRRRGHARLGNGIDESVLSLAAQGYIAKLLGDPAKVQARFDEIETYRPFLQNKAELWSKFEKFKDGTWRLEPEEGQGISGLVEAETLLTSGNLAQALELFKQHQFITAHSPHPLWALGLAHLMRIAADLEAHKAPLPPGAILFPLNKSVQLGRNPDNEVAIPHQAVSGRHASIAVMDMSQLSPGQNPGGYPIIEIRDRGSSNGTILFDKRSGTSVRLAPGQAQHITSDDYYINLGPVQVDFELRPEHGPNPLIAWVPIHEGYHYVIRSFPNIAEPVSGALGEMDSSSAFMLPKINHLDRLLVRDPSTVPEEFRHLIPQPQGIVLFPRFQKILEETASLITAPDRIAIRFFGPAGTAKTTIPEMIASMMGIPLLRVPFSKRTDTSDLDGLWAMEEVAGQYVPVFKEGAPTLAMEHGFHLVLDEPDLARPGVLAYLNNVSAPGEYAWVRKGNGQLVKIKVHSDYRVYSTENGVREVGREEHGKDFLRRFVPYYVGPWTQDEITDVLAERFEMANGHRRWNRQVSQTLAYFHDKMRILAEGLTDPQTRQALPPLGSGIGQRLQFTPRSILRLAQRLAAAGGVNPENLSRAIRAEYILPLADSTERQLVWGQAEAIFGNIGIPVGQRFIPAPTLESISKKYLGGQKIVLGPDFTWTDQALRLTDEILWNRSLGIDVMLLGHAGEGKTEVPPQIAKLVGLNYLQKTVSSETDEQDLVGGPGRVNGKIDFIPDVVTLATRDGGFLHLDEYLLSDTGKLEAVMNPLMDGTRGLILKNPYRLIKRHDDTFIILTSNPPFGEYADRHEHSGAAMSRLAVIFLADEFGMQEKDRLKIMEGWLDKPLPPKKKVSGPERALKEPIYRNTIEAPGGSQVPPKKNPVLQIHPDLQEKFKLPAQLEIKGMDEAGQSIIEETYPDGSKGPLSKATQEAIKKYADYLTRRTQIEMAPLTKKMAKIFYTFGGNHQADLLNKQIKLNLINLLTHSQEGALGTGKHEWAHVVIDRPHEKYDAHEPGRLLANYVGDPRMNEYAGSLRPDFKTQIETMYREMGDWNKEWPEEQQKLFAEKVLPHEQFADAIIYYWRHGEIMPWITNEKVKEALEKALPILKPAFTLFPKSTEEKDVDAAAAQFYQILDKAYPFYESLFPESLKQICQRLEAGATPEEMMMEVLEKLGLKPAPSPPPKDGQGARGEGDGSDQAKTLFMSPKPAGSKPEAGGEKPEVEGPSQAEETPGEGQQAGKVPGEGESASPAKPRSPEELQALAQQIMNQRAEKLADQFEPHDPEVLKKRKEQIAQAKAHSNSEPSEPKPADKSSSEPVAFEPPQALSESEKKKMEADRQKALNSSLQDDLFRSMVPLQAIQAAQRLKRFLPPSDPTHLEGHFTTGKQLDRNKAVQDGLLPVPTGKVMLRRMRPGDFEADVIILTDVSSSMSMAGAVDPTVRASAAAIYLSEQLKLNYGEVVFAGTSKVLKPLGKPLGGYGKKNELLNAKKNAYENPEIVPGTNIRRPLGEAIETLKQRNSKAKFIMLITDGQDMGWGGAKTLPELVEEAEAEGIHLMVLALGDAKHSVPRIFKNYRFANDDGSDIPDRIVDLFGDAHKKRLP